VTLLIDAGPLVALADAEEPQRESILQILRAEPQGLIIPAPVTAEIDYMLGRRFGNQARVAFLADLAAGRFTVACLEQHEYAAVVELDARYGGLHLGLADCSLVVLARRYETTRIVSFDERHFRAVKPMQGGDFAILPADITPDGET
jgi:predicted nucleic acid-binding protein